MKKLFAIVEPAFDTDGVSRAEKAAEAKGKILASATREIDPRVLAQQASFTVHADETPLCEVPFKKSQSGKETPWRYAFRIPAKSKPNIRITLEMLAITKAGLFPDLGALAEHLKEIAFSGEESAPGHVSEDK